MEIKSKMFKLLTLGTLLTVALSATPTFAATNYNQNFNKNGRCVIISPNTMYDWTNTVTISAGGTFQILGPSGNNYCFTTDNGIFEGSYYSTFNISWTATSGLNLSFTAIDVNTGQAYYSGTSSSGSASITGLPRGTFRLYVTDNRSYGNSLNIPFHVMTSGLHSRWE